MDGSRSDEAGGIGAIIRAGYLGAAEVVNQVVDGWLGVRGGWLESVISSTEESVMWSVDRLCEEGIMSFFGHRCWVC